MSRRIFLLVTVAMTWLGLNAAARAQDAAVSVPADSKFVLQLDFQAFRATAIGGKLLEMAKQHATEGLAEKGAGVDKIKEMIGFDPFEEIQSITASASNYERPEKSLVASIRLRKTTGNLEGHLLALPGYAATDYGKYRIHWAAPEMDNPVFAAIHTDAKGDKTVLLAARRDAVTGFLDQLDGKAGSDAAFKKVRMATDGKQFVSLEVLELPAELPKDGPHANVAKILRTISLRIGESTGDLYIMTLLTTAAEQQAEQLRQMAQGMVALLDFAQSANPDDADLKKFQQIVHDIKLDRDGSSLIISLRIPSATLTKLIDAELGNKGNK